jgi:hypothetical protein
VASCAQLATVPGLGRGGAGFHRDPGRLPVPSALPTAGRARLRRRAGHRVPGGRPAGAAGNRREPGGMSSNGPGSATMISSLARPRALSFPGKLPCCGRPCCSHRYEVWSRSSGRPRPSVPKSSGDCNDEGHCRHAAAGMPLAALEATPVLIALSLLGHVRCIADVAAGWRMSLRRLLLRLPGHCPFSGPGGD